MNIALPVNSMRFISGETLGMKRLSISPATKAPKMPSRPMKFDRAALRNNIARTKINCITASL